MTPDPLPGLPSELRLTVGRLSRRLRRNAEGQGLSATLLSALVTVERDGPLSPTELADLEGIQKASVTRILAELEERGLVSRRPHPSDGRQAVVEITRPGRTRLAGDRGKADAWLAGQLDSLPAGDREALKAALPALRQLAGLAPAPETVARPDTSEAASS